MSITSGPSHGRIVHSTYKRPDLSAEDLAAADAIDDLSLELPDDAYRIFRTERAGMWQADALDIITDTCTACGGRRSLGECTV